MARQRLVVMSGLPRSGKTTIVKHLVEEMDTMRVAPDLLRTMVKCGYTFKNVLEPFMFGGADVLMEYFLRKRLNVVYDEINLGVDRRIEIIKKAKAVNPLIAIVGCQLNTSVKVCIERAKEDDRGLGAPYWIECISELFSYLEPMTSIEGYSYIYSPDKLLESDDLSLPGMHPDRMLSEKF